MKRPTRQTLNLENAFLKISRKNVVEEEFATNDILNVQLERHLSRRLMAETVVLIRGELREEVTKKILFPIFLVDDINIKKEGGR